jgi:ASC-1-like (ASCH) protein
MQLKDLVIAATLADTIIIVIDPKDKAENQKAVQVVLHENRWEESNFQNLLKFNPFESVDIDDKSVQRYYRDILHRYLSDNSIIELIGVFGVLE